MSMAEAAFGVSAKPSFCFRPRTISPYQSRSTAICFFPSQGAGFGYLTERLTQSRQNLLSPRVVSSDSKTGPSFVTNFETTQPELDNSGGGGGAGNGFGDGSGGHGRGGGGGDSNGGGGDNNKGEEGLDGDKRKMALSMSQKFTLGYAALVGAGGVMGYLKSGSQKSLLAGGLSASLLFFVYTELPVRPVFASSLGLGISAALLGVMGSRFMKSGKVFPAGVVSLVSLVMTGGYLHGIMRSVH